MDFLGYWGLAHNPFGRDSGNRFFAGQVQREALARLTLLVDGGMSCGVMLSPSGCGMTTLLKQVAKSNGFADCAAEVLMTRGGQPGPNVVFQQLARRMRMAPQSISDQDAVLSAIETTTRQGVRTVWLVDGANEACCRVARLLLDGNRSVTVVLGTTPESAGSLSISLGHCPLQIELPPLSVEETSRFITHSLYMAESNEAIFTDTAIVRLHEIGEGRIGMISSIAHFALIRAAADQQANVTVGMIESADKDLVRAA